MKLHLAAAGAAIAIIGPLLASVPAQAEEFPATPTLTTVDAPTVPVAEGDDIELNWTGEDGGIELFVVRATYRDANWETHELFDGPGDLPTTGVMRATVDSSWASGLAVPTKFEFLDVGGNGRIYYADDPRTPEVESKTVVYYDGRVMGAEPGSPNLFSNAGVSIREEITDTDAPQFTSVSLAQSTAAPDGSLALNWSGADDHTGIRGIRIQFRASDGTDGEFIEEFVYGKPPTSGQILIPVPEDAVEGIYQITSLGIFDNACNERQYLLWGTASLPMSGTTSCASGEVDPELLMPDDFSIAPLAFGVIMARPPMEAPTAPTGTAVARGNGEWTVAWESASAWNNDNSLQFYDWLYQVKLDGDVIAYPWPETETTIDDATVSNGEHTVSVRAVNRFGPGPWSAPVTFSTKPSGPVEDVVVEGRMWGGRVRWTPPSTSESAHHYLVIRRPGSRSLDQMPEPNLTDAGTTVTRYDANDLEPGRNYTFAVFAVDAQGQISEGTVAHLAGTRTKVRPVEIRPRHEVELRGRIVDTSGNGVPGVRVLIQKASASAPADYVRTRVAVETAADGRYRITLTPRRGFKYRVAMPGAPSYGSSWSASLS